MKPTKTDNADSLRRRAEDRLQKQKTPDDSSRSADQTERLLHELQVHQIELEMQNEELQSSRAKVEGLLKRYTDLYDFAPVGYFTLQQNGTISETNLAGAKLLCVDRAKLPGCRFETFVTEPDQPVLANLLRTVFESSSSHTCQVTLATTDQISRTVQIEATQSTEKHCRAIVTDITAEKAAKNALVEIDQARNDFISMAAHELRTPLTAILGFTEVLLDPEISGKFANERKQQFLKEIASGGHALGRIIDELLVVSHIKHGREIVLERAECDFGKVLAEIVASYQLSTPSHIFKLDLSESSDMTIMIDRHRITQVIENLLSNAVKYSPRGSMILVEASSCHDSCEVQIKDHGIGMTPEQIEKIYEKFYRADSSNSAVSGLGLGMNIARKIIWAHGGRIHVDSAKGEGTTVVFSLPRSETAFNPME
ncbi:MAG: hypothetical protein C0618_04435 [Desulfuromonas sp.]|nr:MAG: hypothetical protein C0618_04435 [Desulfuromonas sp.]